MMCSIYLGVPQLHDLLTERANVRDAKGVEQGDAGDGGHGRNLKVVHHRVRHHALHKSRSGNSGGHSRSPATRPAGAARSYDLHLRGHLATAAPVLTWCVVNLTHHSYAFSVAVVVASVKLSRRRLLRLRQPEQLATTATAGRREQRVLGVVGADIRLVELLDAAVEVADGANHGVLAQDLDDRADWQREEGEEEVDDVLARLRVQHAAGLGVHQQLHAERRSDSIRGGWSHDSSRVLDC